MIQTIVGGLVLAAVSALTYLAYKHPAAYEKIVWKLMIGVILVMAGLAIWSGAVEHTFVKLFTLIEPSKIEQGQAIRDSLLPNPVIVVIAGIAAVAYLGLLLFLPNLLEEEDNKRPR